MAVDPVQNLDLRRPPVGNAIQVFFSFPFDASLVASGDGRPVAVRILRKLVSDGSISAPDDADAKVLFEGYPDPLFYMNEPTVDGARINAFEGYKTYRLQDFDVVIKGSGGLINGTDYNYGIYTMDTETFISGTTVVSSLVEESVAPVFRFKYEETEWEELVLERLAAGLKTLIGNGQLLTIKNRLPVVFRGYSVAQKIPLPCVFTHVEKDEWDVNFVGEQQQHGRTFPIEAAPGERVQNKIGKYSDIVVRIENWHRSKEERANTSRAIKYILAANMEVFKEAGAASIRYTGRQTEDIMGTKSVIYSYVHDLNIQAPFFLTETVDGIIEDVDVSIDEFIEYDSLC